MITTTTLVMNITTILMNMLFEYFFRIFFGDKSQTQLLMNRAGAHVNTLIQPIRLFVWHVPPNQVEGMLQAVLNSSDK